MNCYVTYDGTIKLDGYAVGNVCPFVPTDADSEERWIWAAHVNGRLLSGFERHSRRLAFAAVEDRVACHAAVIR